MMENRIRHIIAIACVVPCALGFALSRAFRPAFDEVGGVVAGITVSPQALQLGDVLPGSTTTVQFTLTNTSNTDYVISHVQTDCGCTTASGYDEQLRHGKFASIPITYRADLAPGEVNRKVAVTLASATKKEMLIVHLSATIKPATLLTVFPQTLIFQPDGESPQAIYTRVPDDVADNVPSEIHLHDESERLIDLGQASSTQVVTRKTLVYYALKERIAVDSPKRLVFELSGTRREVMVR